MKRFQRVCCALTALCLLAALLPPRLASAAEPWLWPVAGVYEMARGVGPGHGGIDISAEFGTPVMATKSGTVIESSNACPHVNYSRRACWCNAGLGNYVKLQHDDGTYSRYMHLKQGTALPVGARVKQGEYVGRSGSSGDSTGPHLHFDAYTTDNVRFFCNPTDARHTVHSDNGINYVYSVILQPAQPRLSAIPNRVQLGTPICFAWGQTENTTDYTLTILRRDGGSYPAFETVTGAKSGLTRTLPAGDYRVELQAVNRGTGNNAAVHWKTAVSTPAEFSVRDYTPAKPVLQLSDQTSGGSFGVTLRWKDVTDASFCLLTVAVLREDGLFHVCQTLRGVRSPLQPELSAGRYRVQLQAVNEELTDENGQALHLQADSDWLLFDVVPDCAGVHEITTQRTEPSCTSGGYTLRCCAVDGLQWVSDAAAPLGHDWTQAQPVTDGQKALLRSSCARCGAERTELSTSSPPKSCDGGSGCPSAQFSDLPRPGSWAHAGIDWAVQNGVTLGTDAGHFSPQEGANRGQVVTFLWRAAGSPLPENEPQNPFTDLKKTDYCYYAVLWAAENGITNGTSSTGFDAKQLCTRAQLVTFLWRWKGYARSEAALPFTDVAPGCYYEQAVRWAVEQGVTTGESAASFGPEHTCTRAQAVTLLRRAVCPEN